MDKCHFSFYNNKVRLTDGFIFGQGHEEESVMQTYTAVVERCSDTGMYVGFIPGFPGAHSQGETLDELNANLKEVLEMLLEDGQPKLESEFIGTQNVMVA
jgi:predicted RNase H-like HicB family nuclease